ncbi:hypothetical protein F5878DRAFT_643748, partial [Lentinula raphanica]
RYRLSLYTYLRSSRPNLRSPALNTVFGIQTPSATAYVADWSWLLTTLFSLGAFVDLGVALALCSYLYSQRATSIANDIQADTVDSNRSLDEYSLCSHRDQLCHYAGQLYARIYFIRRLLRFSSPYSGLDFDVYVTREMLNSRPALKASAGSNVITLSTVIGGSLSNQINTGRLNNLQAPRSGGSDEDRTVNISQVVETRTDSDDIYTFTPKNGKMKLESDV